MLHKQGPLVHLQSGRRFPSATSWPNGRTCLACARKISAATRSCLFQSCSESRSSAGMERPGMHIVSCRYYETCPVHFDHVRFLAFPRARQKAVSLALIRSEYSFACFASRKKKKRKKESLLLRISAFQIFGLSGSFNFISPKSSSKMVYPNSDSEFYL